MMKLALPFVVCLFVCMMKLPFFFFFFFGMDLYLNETRRFNVFSFSIGRISMHSL